MFLCHVCLRYRLIFYIHSPHFYLQTSSLHSPYSILTSTIITLDLPPSEDCRLVEWAQMTYRYVTAMNRHQHQPNNRMPRYWIYRTPWWVSWYLLAVPVHSLLWQWKSQSLTPLLFLIFFHIYNTALRWLPQDTILLLDHRNVITLCQATSLLSDLIWSFSTRILWRSWSFVIMTEVQD